MPYASSIQVVNDANGTAHAFLENDGLLWQCQWNPEAQRWDKGQVVPGAYGGEKLQVLLVDNLWRSSGTTGTTGGNTPGIVLAYRVGEGDAAMVQPTLGGWGSDGQLSWSEPLQLVGSGSAIEQIHLVQTQAGGFQLVYQWREPVGAGSTSTALNDSDLLSCSFELSASQASTGNSYNLVNTTAGTSSAINSAEGPAPAAPAVQAPDGSTSFSRSDLQLSQAPATATYGLLSARSSATDPAASNSAGSRGFTQGGKINLSYQRQNSKKTNTATAGLNWSDQQVRWQFEPKNTTKKYFDNNGKDENYDVNLNDDISEIELFQKFGFRNGQTVKLSGSFGAFTFGQQSAISSASLSWSPLSKKSDKVKAENLSSYLKSDANATSKSTLQGSLSGSLSTTYSFQKLLPRSGENYLNKITQKANVSVGLNYNYKRMVDAAEASGIINLQASVEAGFVFINTISPSPQATSAASAFPNWIRNAGDFYAYAGGALGLAEGVYGGLQARYLKKTNQISSFGKYDQLKRQKGRPIGVDLVIGGMGMSGIILPDFLYIQKNANHNNQLQSTQQYGLSLAATFSGTYLWGGYNRP